jgi:hypothetical protein
MTLLIEDAAACVMYIWPNIETTKKEIKMEKNNKIK